MENVLQVSNHSIFGVVKGFIQSIEGVFVDYDESRFAVIVPLVQSKRIQRVFGVLDHQKHKLEFKSIVCKKEDAKFEQLLETQKSFVYSKFLMDDDNVMISASISFENVNQELIKSIILEVAESADKWELELTGKDIY